MPQDIRRIVTGLNAAGRSAISFEGTALNVMDVAGWPGARITELWVTEEVPVDNSGTADRGARPIRHDPLSRGSIFRVVEIPPERSVGRAIDPAAVFAHMGSRHVPSDADTSKHASMHATDSIDYLIVISGEMQMQMEDGETLLRPGDCIVQRGVKHAWVNRSDQPCVLAAVLIDAKPHATET